MKTTLALAALLLSAASTASLADTSSKKIAFSNNYAGNSWRQAMLTSYGKVSEKAVADKVVAAPPTNFQSTIKIGSGLSAPSGFEFAPDGRIFVLQRTGEIKVYKNGSMIKTQKFNLDGTFSISLPVGTYDIYPDDSPDNLSTPHLYVTTPYMWQEHFPQQAIISANQITTLNLNARYTCNAI